MRRKDKTAGWNLRRMCHLAAGAHHGADCALHEGCQQAALATRAQRRDHRVVPLPVLELQHRRWLHPNLYFHPPAPSLNRGVPVCLRVKEGERRTHAGLR